jgi:predicted transcriptional regulator
MAQRARDKYTVKCAAKLYYDGMTYHEIARSLHLSHSAVHKWSSRQEWIDEIDRLREEDTRFIQRSPASYTKLKEQLKQTEGNAKTCNIIVKELYIKILALVRKPELDSAEVKDLRSLMQSLKDADEMFRQNLNFTFSLDDVTKRLEDLTEQ